MSSLLFQRLREDHGVAYDVAAHFPALAGPAPFVLMASSVEERSELALELLLKALPSKLGRYVCVCVCVCVCYD